MAKNQVVLIGRTPTRKEYAKIATTGMRPGELVIINGSGELARGAVAAAAQEVLILLEDDLQGKTINDTYTAGDVAPYLIAQRGDVVNLRLKTGNTITLGEALDAAGALGEVQECTVATTKQIIAWAQEARSTEGLITARIQ